jgi:hypothetical protein
MVFVDNDRCLRCGTTLGFSPSDMTVQEVGVDDRRCANHPLVGCSWLVEDGEELCRSCRLTRTRPPAGDPDASRSWADTETAKRQLVLQAIDLGLDLSGVTFDLKSGDHEDVITGHADGVITVDVREADDVTRTRMRERMGEAYRTMLGHFRHEISHYLWMVMVDGTEHLESCRDVFGDDRADYAQALEAHYASAAPDGWEDTYVSVYATAHPWEDFAETLAHYLHIRDTLETAASFGMHIAGPHPILEAEPEEAVQSAADDGDIRPIMDQWLPLTYALNAVNRSMGAKPLYPFVLAPTVIAKLGWVHRLISHTAPPAQAQNQPQNQTQNQTQTQTQTQTGVGI